MPEYVAFAHRFGIICMFLWRTARIFVVKEWCGNFCSVNRWIWGLESTSAQPFPILHESGDFIISHKRIIFYCAESALFNFLHCPLWIVNYYRLTSPYLLRTFPVATPLLPRSYSVATSNLAAYFPVASLLLLRTFWLTSKYASSFFPLVTTLLLFCYLLAIPYPESCFFGSFLHDDSLLAYCCRIAYARLA